MGPKAWRDYQKWLHLRYLAAAGTTAPAPVSTAAAADVQHRPAVRLGAWAVGGSVVAPGPYDIPRSDEILRALVPAESGGRVPKGNGIFIVVR